MRLNNILKWRFKDPVSRASKTPYTVLVLAPAYDGLTSHTASWLETLEIPKRLAAEKLVREQPEKKSIRALLRRMSAGQTLAVFGGHGAPDALLGPPRGDTDTWVNGALHSVIYDRDLFYSGPTALLAFCCAAGKEIGPWFGSAPGRVFLGYKDDLLLVATNDECSKRWKSIIHSLCSDIFRVGHISPEHKTFLAELYDDALHYFVDGDGRKNPDNVDMIMALLNHRRNLCYYEAGGRVPNT